MNNQRKSNNMLMMEIEGQLTTHHQKLAENFNTYYISAVDNIISKKQVNDTITDPDIKDPLSYLYSAFQQPFTNIKLKNATTGEIGKIITQLKNKNSCGYDEVSAEILNIASLFIVSPLTYSCNGMLATGTFPDRLKYSEIKPIYKKGDKTQFQTTDQSHYFQYFLKSLKKFYIRDYTIT